MAIEIILDSEGRIDFEATQQHREAFGIKFDESKEPGKYNPDPVVGPFVYKDRIVSGVLNELGQMSILESNCPGQEPLSTEERDFLAGELKKMHELERMSS